MTKQTLQQQMEISKKRFDELNNEYPAEEGLYFNPNEFIDLLNEGASGLRHGKFRCDGFEHMAAYNGREIITISDKPIQEI